MPEFPTVAKVAIGCAVAAASAGAVYYLFRTEEQAVVVNTVAAVETSKKVVVEKLDVKKVTVDQLLNIMGKILESQNVMKGVMKNITEDIKSSDLSFGQVYEVVKQKQPNDPMEELGLTMQEFDELLDKYQEEPRVLDAIAKIMGPSDEDMAGDDGKILSVQDLIDIHQYMLNDLMEISVSAKKSALEMDPRVSTAAAQVLVGARVEKRFNVTSPAVERSVMMHQNQLATNHQFATINMMMQQAMTELMGDNVTGRE